MNVLIKAMTIVIASLRSLSAFAPILISSSLVISISSGADRTQFAGVPSELVVFDFLAAMKERHSVESSKKLWSFIESSGGKQKEGISGEAGIRTVLVTKIFSVEQSTIQDLVAAIVSTDECDVEVFVFSIDNQSGLIKLPKDYDPFSPYRTAWTIRAQKGK